MREISELYINYERLTIIYIDCKIDGKHLCRQRSRSLVYLYSSRYKFDCEPPNRNGYLTSSRPKRPSKVQDNEGVFFSFFFSFLQKDTKDKEARTKCTLCTSERHWPLYRFCGGKMHCSPTDISSCHSEPLETK